MKGAPVEIAGLGVAGLLLWRLYSYVLRPLCGGPHAIRREREREKFIDNQIVLVRGEAILRMVLSQFPPDYM